jgi:hypothetical protein
MLSALKGRAKVISTLRVANLAGLRRLRQVYSEPGFRIAQNGRSNIYSLIKHQLFQRGKIVMVKRNKFIWCLFLIVAFSGSAALAQEIHTPVEGSPESAAILSALSVPVSRDLKQKITFSTEKFKVQGNWAFVAGKARDAKGGDPNWKLTKQQALIDSGDFEDNLFGLLKKTNGKWRVVTYMISCQDVCYLGWDKQYKAPKAIIE